jgi:gamma-glutamylcyclotransferase (GGCT)/AIG2-like uncharacterized protein YtfP
MLFVYGSLIDPAVQLEVIDRNPAMEPYVVTGYKKSTLMIDNQKWFIAEPSDGDSVDGMIMELNEAELEAIDVWEGESYQRVTDNEGLFLYAKPR